MIFTGSKDLAEYWIRQIALEVQTNERLLEVFGDLSTDGLANGVWRSDELLMSNGYVVRAAGRESRSRGFHPKRIKLDDIEDRESAVSEAQCRQITDWLKGDVEGMMGTPDCSVVWIGTTISPGCVIDNAYRGRGWSGDWFRLKYSVLGADGKSIWEDKYSTEFLLEKQRQGAKSFACEYMNEPIISENPIVLREYFKYYKQEDLPVNLYRIMAMDLAVKTKEANDYTAVVCMGVALSGANKLNIYVLDADRGRWNTDGKIKRVFDMYRAWRPDVIRVESTAAQLFFVERLHEKSRDLGDYLPIEKVEPVTDKYSRLQKVLHLFEGGFVHFRSAGQDDLMDELISFPVGQYDDYVDAIQMCLEKAKAVIEGVKRSELEPDEKFPEPAIPKLGW
jgi:predicted phage terminase large subunit-like protein